MAQRVRQLIGGEWLDGEPAIASVDPATGIDVAVASATSWARIDNGIDRGVHAQLHLTEMGPEPIARFLEDLAVRIERRRNELVDAAHRETGLPAQSRLTEIEIPRTTNQLRQAGRAARSRSWIRPTISSAANIRSILTPLRGPVITIGPSNFPFAFNSVSGGDAAAAWATGHPVIAKAHPAHLLTSYLLAQEAFAAAADAGLPDAMLQVVYGVDPADGFRMVSDQRVAATAFTGSRRAGMALKGAADGAGVPIYLEMSSVNPVVVLAGAARDRAEGIAEELALSVTTGVGQFCTKPGLVFVVDDVDGRRMLESLAHLIAADGGGLMMTTGLNRSFHESVEELMNSGAAFIACGSQPDRATATAARLLTVDGAGFLERAGELQTEAFGPAMLVVVCRNVDELTGCLALVQGSLAGAIYMTPADRNDSTKVVDLLSSRVGRIVVNRPPTGVKVVGAMNHGGPFPSAGHPGFTAVGVPRSMERFGKLTCYDGMLDEDLPPELQDANPLGLWREIDGDYSREPVVTLNRNQQGGQSTGGRTAQT